MTPVEQRRALRELEAGRLRRLAEAHRKQALDTRRFWQWGTARAYQEQAEAIEEELRKETTE